MNFHIIDVEPLGSIQWRWESVKFPRLAADSYAVKNFGFISEIDAPALTGVWRFPH